MLSVTGISKSFPGVKSLQDVDFSVDAGEIHALVGDNGAGKSTLIKIISGAYVPDQGTIELDGRKVAWTDPREAQSAGIHVIYQELALFPELTVAENVFINDQPINRLGIIDYGRMKQRARGDAGDGRGQSEPVDFVDGRSRFVRRLSAPPGDSARRARTPAS